MKCADARELLSAYLDDALDADQRSRLEDHLRECPACALELAQLKQTLALLGNLEEIEPPAEFHAELHERLQRLATNGRAAGRTQRVPWLLTLPALSLRSAVAAALVLVITLAGGIGIGTQLASRLGSNPEALTTKNRAGAPDVPWGPGTGMGGAGNNTPTAPDTGAAAQGQPDATGAEPQVGIASKSAMFAAPENQVVSQPAQKILRYCDMTLAVEDINAAQQNISAIATAHGGYIENSSFQQVTADTARAMLQMRVPNAQLEAAAAEARKLGQVKNEGTSATDVTATYVDAEARLKNLNLQEQRLQEVLKVATTVDDILRVENELSRVRTDIDLTNTTLKNVQSGVEMATLTVNLEQDPGAVAIGSDQSFWNRVRGACINTFKAIGRFLVNFAIFVGGALPVIAIAAVLWMILRPQRWFRRGQ